MDKLVAQFISQRTISLDIELNAPLHDAIYYLEKSDRFVATTCEKYADRLTEFVPWPSMRDMYERNYEYCCGVLGSFLIGQFPSSEALCRTAIEGAVNLHYVSLGDSMNKLIAYYKSYLFTERKQNRAWKESITRGNYPLEVKQHHFESISAK